MVFIWLHLLLCKMWQKWKRQMYLTDIFDLSRSYFIGIFVILKVIKLLRCFGGVFWSDVVEIFTCVAFARRRELIHLRCDNCCGCHEKLTKWQSATVSYIVINSDRQWLWSNSLLFWQSVFHHEYQQQQENAIQYNSTQYNTPLRKREQLI